MSDDPSRALVLGGGGPVGVGWESGLLVGLAAADLDLRDADLIVGASAGSLAGAQLASGHAFDALIECLSHGDLRIDPITDFGRADRLDLGSLRAALADALEPDTDREAARRRLGQLALGASTISEDAYVGRFGLAGRTWPDPFVCTGVDVATGRFVAWDVQAGVDLQRAVAASRCVPTLLPPVTIGGNRYTDGGVRDPLNADLARGHDVVIAVTCLPLDQPPGPTRDHLDVLRRDGSHVAVVDPSEEFPALSGRGAHLMDSARVEEASRLGQLHGAIEAGRLAPLWSVA